MKNLINRLSFIIILLFAVASTASTSLKKDPPGFILEHEKDIAREQPGPHNGGGLSTAYSFFANAPGFKLAFRKRALHQGAAIGYHLQKEDEIYYVLSGTGEMEMNGKSFPVTAGDAILTRPGSSHGLKQTGKDDLVIFIVYEQ